jgi:hypothetical protein
MATKINKQTVFGHTSWVVRTVSSVTGKWIIVGEFDTAEAASAEALTWVVL